MASEELHIAQAPAGQSDFASRLGDEVRRPECDEQPSSSSSANIVTNQLTMLFAVISPPRSERMIGPKRPVSSLSSINARLSCG